MSESLLPQPPRPIRFVHRGQVQQVSGLPPTTTVLQWLREHAHCTGTKEGCAEGDCGACTVVVGELDAAGQLTRHTVNSCIQFVPTLDGKVLYTVEDVANGPDLHPCQQALVNEHGSQCGFCTPGFVMSLWHVYQTHTQAPPRSELANALAGNLCRCTGYRPILDASQAMFQPPRVERDDALDIKQLQILQPHQDGPLLYVGPCTSHGGHAQRFVAPRTVDELAYWREKWPQARLLAGGTDIGLWVTKQFKDLGDIIYLGQVKALADVQFTATHLEIGATASLEAAWSGLVNTWPALREIWLRFASPPIRHAGTLGGNIANGSPIGDGAPVLLALNASVVLRQGQNQREVPLSAFYVDYMRNVMAPGEWVERIRVPLPDVTLATAATQTGVVRAYKVSKRRDSDISAVCAAFAFQLKGTTIVAARLAWGGMAATAKRAPLAEAALVGRPWSQATLRQAQAALTQDFSPLTDLRASDRHRQRLAANLLERFWLETRPDAPLAAEQVQVWPAPAAGAAT